MSSAESHFVEAVVLAMAAVEAVVVMAFDYFDYSPSYIAVGLLEPEGLLLAGTVELGFEQ